MIKRITFAATAVALAALGFSATASADEYVSSTSVPGHVKQERQGKVVNHYTQTDADGCDYIVNTLGDFGGDPYLNNGKMLNVIQCPDGSVTTYHIFHESHPAYNADRLTPIWGSWGYFATSNQNVTS